MRKIKVAYVEPDDYFPKETRKKYKLGEFAESEELYKIKSVMLGHAVGDALGVPVEFSSRAELEKNPVADMRGFGTYNVPAGSWSDDTSMSLATLDVLCRKNWRWEYVMNNFSAWLSGGKYTPTGETFDVGRTCREAIMHYSNGRASATGCGKTDEYSNGNGSLMRIHPFVLYAHVNRMPFFEWLEFIKTASSLTHAHECSKLGCLIYAFVLIHLLGDPNKDSIALGLRRAECHLREFSEIKRYKRLWSSDFAKLPVSEIKSSGYVVDTLEAALWCVLTTDNYRDCVLKAVNLGGDTDTVAAIAGGLAGILYGYDSIQKEWLDTLKRREYIDNMCKAAADAWAR